MYPQAYIRLDALFPESLQRTAEVTLLDDQERLSGKLLQRDCALPGQRMILRQHGLVFAFLQKGGFPAVNAHVDKVEIHLAGPHPLRDGVYRNSPVFDFDTKYRAVPCILFNILWLCRKFRNRTLSLKYTLNIL